MLKPRGLSLAPQATARPFLHIYGWILSGPAVGKCLLGVEVLEGQNPGDSLRVTVVAVSSRYLADLSSALSADDNSAIPFTQEVI